MWSVYDDIGATTEVKKQCGGSHCIVCKKNMGCLTCQDSDMWKKFSLGGNQYLGCKKDVNGSNENSCTDGEKTNGQCFKKLHTKPIDYSKYYDNSEKEFILKIENETLKKFLKNDNLLKQLSIIPDNAKCISSKSSFSTTIEIGTDNGKVRLKLIPTKECQKYLGASQTTKFHLERKDIIENGKSQREMSFFTFADTSKNTSSKRLRIIQDTDTTNKQRLDSFILIPAQARHFYHQDNNKGLRKEIDEDMKKQKLTDLNLKKESISYKYKKIQNSSQWIRIGAIISSPFLGINLAVIAMTLSLVIQLFHKMILFNTQFGPYLNYFLVASSSVLDDDEEGHSKFTPRWNNKRFIEEAELNAYTIDAFPLEMFMLFGFFILKFIRYCLRTCVFAKWEEKHGTEIYKVKKSVNTMKDPKTLIILKKDSSSSKKKVLNEELKKEENPEFQFNCWKKFLIKIYSLTYILEFILICRLVCDVVLHTGYNLTRIDYSKNKPDFKLVFNHLVSFLALVILIYEISRFIRINYQFMKGVLHVKHKKIKLKRFKVLQKLYKSKKNEGKKNVELTKKQKQLLDKKAEDLDEEELDQIEDISMCDSDFSSDLEFEAEIDFSNIVKQYDSDEDEIVLGTVDDVQNNRETDNGEGSDESSSFDTNDNNDENGLGEIQPTKDKDSQKMAKGKENKLSAAEAKKNAKKAFEEEDEYNPLDWRLFQRHESAKILLDNFCKFPIPEEATVPQNGKKNLNFWLLIIIIKIKELPDQFLPYLNLFIAARLVLYEVMILSFQSLPLVQILPLIFIELFVAISIMVGHFTYSCFENWGFFRYMCQQLTITLILFMAVLGSEPMQVKIYGENVDERGKALDKKFIVSKGNFFEVAVVIGIILTVLVEVFEIFRKAFGDLKVAWVRGGKEGKTGLLRLFGSNEGETVFLENLLEII